MARTSDGDEHGPRRGLAHRSRWALGFTLSALLHLVALAVSPRFIGFAPTITAPGSAAAPPEGIRVIALAPETEAARPVDAPAEPPEPEPEPEPRVEPPSPEPTGPRVRRDRPEAASASPSAAERLAPGLHDPRLWVLPGARPPERSPAERMRDDLGARLAEVADSSRRAREAADRPTDWTSPEGDGAPWGLSPGRLHLGTTTLSLCGGSHGAADCGFGVSPGRREAYGERMRRLEEIDGQMIRARVAKTFEERARAIRARNDAKRDSVGPSGA